jgi:hypothetical protein
MPDEIAQLRRTAFRGTSMETIRRYGTAFGGSLFIASLANALLFAAKENSPALMEWMQRATGHHWLTHSIAVLLLFMLLGIAFAVLVPALMRRPGDNSMAASIAANVLVGAALIVGFLLL